MDKEKLGWEYNNPGLPKEKEHNLSELINKITIGERATNYAEERCGRLDYATGQQAYIKGATDQQEIDIEKACEWLKSTIPSGLGMFNIEELMEDIRKAMEE